MELPFQPLGTEKSKSSLINNVAQVLNKIKTSSFWTRLTHWEFWPFEIIYLPIYFYWVWLAIQSRSFFFFSASNPGIEYGGMLGESKYKIHKILPQNIVPVTVLMKKDSSFAQVKKILSENNLEYPVILKPDIGERGWMVAKITNDEELKLYLSNSSVDFLVQEYIDLPIELGVFYHRYPDQGKGKVTSIVQKKMLTVKGTGKDSIYDLMQGDPRARLQIRTFLHDYPELLKNIPRDGELVELMPIGNHIRGTTFLNSNTFAEGFPFISGLSILAAVAPLSNANRVSPFSNVRGNDGSVVIFPPSL